MKRATHILSKSTSGEYISIHALVKRATTDYKIKFIAKKISIHALVKRATYKIINARCYLSDFNPRPREEGDLS